MFMNRFPLYVVILISTLEGTLAVGTKCPKPELISPCRCIVKRDERQVWCSHSDLPKVLSGLRSLDKHLPTPIDELILENNYLPSLPGRSFANLKVLRIMLRHNGLERVSNDWLHGLEENLMELFIVEPKLRYLPDDSLKRMNVLEAITIQTNDLKRLPQISSLPKLRYLQIESVTLAELLPDNFENLPVLERFQMSGSKNLGRLEANLFHDLPLLKSINISRCGIFWIHPRAFSNLPSLQEVSLEYNHLEDAGMVGRACKDLHALKNLRLDHNDINMLSKGSFVDLPSLENLHISFNNITEIHEAAFHRVPRLRILHLNHNKVRKIHQEFFLHRSGSGLEELCMIENQISQISEVRSLLNALPRLIYLDLSLNNIQGIPFGSLQGHATLEVLKFASNKIRQIDKESFMAMPALRELNLRNNSLSNNNQGPLWNLPSLKGMDLSMNKWRKIDLFFFSNLPSLRRVDMSDNELVIIDPSAFTMTPMIEYVNLSNNNIQFIHPTTFKPLEKLYELDIGRNYLEEFIVELPEGLEYLHLNINKLRTIPSLSGYKLYSLKYLDLSYNLIGKMNDYSLKRVPSLRRLYMTNNFLQRLEAGILDSLPKLEVLDLRSNKIVSVHQDSFRNSINLVELNLKNNFIETFFTKTIQGMPKLTKLDLSGNKLVDFLHENLDNISNLRHLNISHNFLVEMPRNLFRIKDLMVVDLSHNRIKYLPVEAFSKLSHLVDLRISFNFIRELRLSTFSKLKKLRVVYLDHNDIDKIETNTFHSLPSLEMIKLDNNKLSIIPSYTFNNLTMLQVVELQSNSLENLASDAFNISPNLIFLNLSNNDIKSVEESGLRNVPSLEVLDLSRNDIRKVEPDSFKHMKWLVDLKMDENRICQIVGSPFSDMPRLRIISLRWNRLKRVSEKILDKIRTNIALFDVDGNPLVCDCNALWLKVWSEESSMIGPHCSNGLLVRELKLSSAYCKQKPMKENHNDCEKFPNQYSQSFSEYTNLRNVSSEKKANGLAPLPQESEYFYDEYIDYPFNDSLSLGDRDDEGILDRFLKVNHSSLMEAPVSSHIIPGDTPTLYAAPSKNKTKPDIPKEVPHSPSSSGFTFFGVPLPSINFNQILGGNRNNAAKSAQNMKSVVPTADRKMAIMNIPAASGTTARNIYRLPPSTPLIETGGFRPMLPGEGGFRPMLETTTPSTEVRRKTSSEENVKATLNPLNEHIMDNPVSPEDSLKAGSSTIIKNTTEKQRFQDISKREGFRQETTKSLLNSIEQTTLVSIESSTHEAEVDRNENQSDLKKQQSNNEENKLEILGISLNGTKLPPNNTETSESDLDAVTEVYASSESSLATGGQNKTISSSTTSTESSILSTIGPSPIIPNVHEDVPAVTNGSWEEITSKTKINDRVLSLDQIAKVTNATTSSPNKLPKPTLLIPGGQQPHTRSAGRSTIIKVQSPFSTSSSPLIRETGSQLVKDVGEAVTLDPKITKVDESEESWYFANYNKTYSEPYLGVRHSGSERFGVSFLILLVCVVFIRLGEIG